MEGEKVFSPEYRRESKNILLDAPELVLPEEEKERDVSFSFYSDSRSYRFGHKDGKPFFAIEFFELLPDGLSKEEKKQFTKEIRDGRTVYLLKEGEVPEPKRGEYHIAKPRDFSDRERLLPKPQEIERSELVEILKEKKALFYTGAGISVASGVHDMNQLQECLGIEMSKEIDGLLEKAVANPEKVIDLWQEFIKVASKKPATAAHQSLGRLAQRLNSQIFTENVDNLQEKAGVKARHLTRDWLKKNIQPEWLKEIDSVITIGLSYDDRGFLGWYKENNPNGKIVAVNLNQPSYLGNEDFLLKGDCQEEIPKLEEMIL